MLNVKERIAQYSDEQLMGIRVRLSVQRRRLTTEFLGGVGSIEPVFGTLVGAIAGKKIEKFGVATLEDFRRFDNMYTVMDRSNILVSLQDKLDTAAFRRGLKVDW